MNGAGEGWVADKNNFKWPEHFSVAVWNGPGLADIYGKWTLLLAGDTGMQTHIALTSDTIVNRFRWLRLGIVDITSAGPAEISPVLEGDSHYGCGDRDTIVFPVRAVWLATRNNSGFIVRADSHIKSIYDVKPGVRFVDMRPYLPNQRNVDGFLAWAGIKVPEKEVNWVPAHSTEEKVRLVLEGKADIASVIPSAPSTYEAEKDPHGIRWIDLNAEKDPEGAKLFCEKYAVLDFAPMFKGVPSAMGHWGTVGTSLFYCRADADTEFIYNLVKWLDTSWPRFKDFDPWLEQTNLNNLMVELDTTFAPCHDGLIKYLKELGLWTSAHEKRQQENFHLLDRYCEAAQKAMWLADAKGIVVSKDSPEWAALWGNYKRELGLAPFLKLTSLGKSRG